MERIKIADQMQLRQRSSETGKQEYAEKSEVRFPYFIYQAVNASQVLGSVALFLSRNPVTDSSLCTCEMTFPNC